MEHLYLKELETYKEYYSNLKDDPRQAVWKEERKVYGFDETETWSLDCTFYFWLYERLRHFVDVGGKTVDLHYHKFTFKDKEYYQDELINMMLERIRIFFSESYNEFDEEQYKYVHEIEQIWSIVLPAMWW